MNNQSKTKISEADAAEMLADINLLIFESALAQLLVELDDVEVAKVQEFIEANQESDTLVADLVGQYPNLQRYLEEVGGALEEKARVLNA
jgi:hypothetical protein